MKAELLGRQVVGEHPLGKDLVKDGVAYTETIDDLHRKGDFSCCLHGGIVAQSGS